MLLDFCEALSENIENTIFAGNSYIVGGAVRDHLLGAKEIWDFDVTVEIHDGGLRLAKLLKREHSGFEFIRLNRSFGTASFYWRDAHVDLNGTRKEIYKSGSRFPIIKAADLLEDVMRRDFTVNALLIEPLSGQIIDLCGRGLPDLEARLIRGMKDAHTLLKEDPLRILRAIRFAALLEFELCPDLQDALRDCAPLVKKISSQRRKMEMELMRVGGKLKQGMALMKEFGIV